MRDTMQDELLIRPLVQRWAVWRDAGDWERFATFWHPDGVMMAPFEHVMHAVMAQTDRPEIRRVYLGLEAS